MDSVGNIEFFLDEEGICNYCYEYRKKEKSRLIPDSLREEFLTDIKSKIKTAGKNKKYDCVIGVSGGGDSTFTAYQVKKLGLRPLAVHFDNGWNSELAVNNIQKTLESLDIDLYTYVVDWEEFKDLQRSFLKSSTPDGEIPTDHAILATLYYIAGKFGIKYIISGNNFKTEGVMPRYWAYGHIDWKYIKSVHKKYGIKRLKTYPHFTLFKFIWFTFFKKIQMISILNYIDYCKSEAMEIIYRELNWKNYGGKHYESNYTKFYQGYILPVKFGIDKRKLHLSALILSGQINRQDAIKELKSEPYPQDKLEFDKNYFRKKLNMDIQDFENILNEKKKTFFNYPNSYFMHNIYRKLLSFLRELGLFYR